MTDDHIPWDVSARLGEPLNDLARSLELWQDRDDTKTQPHVRRAASKAVDAMGTMLRELHLMRARLISEIRADDDAFEARTAGRDADAGETGRGRDGQGHLID